jgi:arylsulfatase
MNMPRVLLFCSDKFLGKSGAGLYGDVIMEIDWSVGQVMKAIEESGVEQSTIVVFSSDNGPWYEYGNHASTTHFREHKPTGFDGGTRSATILRYPRKIRGGSQLDRIISSVDLLPTLLSLAKNPAIIVGYV